MFICCAGRLQCLFYLSVPYKEDIGYLYYKANIAWGGGAAPSKNRRWKRNKGLFPPMGSLQFPSFISKLFKVLTRLPMPIHNGKIDGEEIGRLSMDCLNGIVSRPICGKIPSVHQTQEHRQRIVFFISIFFSCISHYLLFPVSLFFSIFSPTTRIVLISLDVSNIRKLRTH